MLLRESQSGVKHFQIRTWNLEGNSLLEKYALACHIWILGLFHFCQVHDSSTNVSGFVTVEQDDKRGFSVALGPHPKHISHPLDEYWVYWWGDTCVD